MRAKVLYGLSLVGLIWSVGVFANQPLTSPGAVLDALNERTGNVIVAMVDDPRGRTQWTTQLSNRLRGVDVSLNAQPLGHLRTNSLRYVRPRLGVNRIAVALEDAGAAFQFPAFRSAGVPTGIVVLTAGAVDTMRLTSLTPGRSGSDPECIDAIVGRWDAAGDCSDSESRHRACGACSTQYRSMDQSI